MSPNIPPRDPPGEPPPASPAIAVGVAGWSYPDWRGTFYPVRRDRVPDLARVVRHFDCVEINLPFYRLPEPRMAEGWLRIAETKPGFLFTTKVPKELTHGDLPPDEAAKLAGALKDSLRPLIEGGRLGAVLLQFPFYFRDGPESRDRIRRLVDDLRPLPASVEVRSLSFFFGPPRRTAADEKKGRAGGVEEMGGEEAAPPGELATGPGSAIRFLEDLGAGIVNIDVPPSRGSVPPTSINTSPLGYVRLHGRNGRAWFDPRAGRDQKYDYRYSTAELAAWKERILKLGERTARTFVILNNHFRAQAPANAAELLHLLGRAPGPLPAELLHTYPDLRAYPKPAIPGPEPSGPDRQLPADSRGSP